MLYACMSHASQLQAINDRMIVLYLCIRCSFMAGSEWLSETRKAK